jgi:hypothetical protein
MDPSVDASWTHSLFQRQQPTRPGQFDRHRHRRLTHRHGGVDLVQHHADSQQFGNHPDPGDVLRISRGVKRRFRIVIVRIDGHRG